MRGAWYVILATLCTADLLSPEGRKFSFRRAEEPLLLGDGGAGGEPAAVLKSQSYEEGQEDYAENYESNSSDYVRQYAYDPSMKDPKNTIFARAGERMKRKSEQPEDENAEVGGGKRSEEEGLAELNGASGGFSRAVAGCAPRTLQELARNYKWMVAATKQFIKAANRTVMERVLEECACVTHMEASTCEPPVDLACLEHRSRRKEDTEEEEYEDYEEGGASSKLISGQGGTSGRSLRRRRPGPRTRRFARGDDKEAPTAEAKVTGLPGLGDHATTQQRGSDEAVRGVPTCGQASPAEEQ